MGSILNIGLYHYLFVAAVLLVLGLYTVSTRRNAIGVLLGIELILNAASLNFAAFSNLGIGNMGGNVTVLFIIALAAAESVVALAIVLSIFNSYRTISLDKTDRMKE